MGGDGECESSSIGRNGRALLQSGVKPAVGKAQPAAFELNHDDAAEHSPAKSDNHVTRASGSVLQQQQREAEVAEPSGDNETSSEAEVSHGDVQLPTGNETEKGGAVGQKISIVAIASLIFASGA